MNRMMTTALAPPPTHEVPAGQNFHVGANYFPKDRAGLNAYDPAGFARIEKLWGVKANQ